MKITCMDCTSTHRGAREKSSLIDYRVHHVTMKYGSFVLNYIYWLWILYNCLYKWHTPIQLQVYNSIALGWSSLHSSGYLSKGYKWAIAIGEHLPSCVLSLLWWMTWRHSVHCGNIVSWRKGTGRLYITDSEYWGACRWVGDHQKCTKST